MSATPYILYVPEVALEKIFSFLSYDEIAKNRLVCRKFNETGSNMLSRGFIQLEKRHFTIHKRVKSLLPRRESERRVHPLSRHCDILQAVETRISMLNMTYMKYIENNLVCFIPGKVLDEMMKVLNLVESDYTPPRTHQLLQELRDLSSMAMEHFDEHVLPRVKEHKEELDERRQSSFFGSISNSAISKPPKLLIVQQVLQTELRKIKKQYKNYKHHITFVTQSNQKLFQKIRKQNIRLKAQSVKMRDQERKMQEQSAKIQEQEIALADIKKHMDDWDQKYKDLTTELVRARDELLKSTNPPNTNQKPLPSVPLQEPFFKATIKPRMAQISTRNYSPLKMDLERKRKSVLFPEIPIKLSRTLDCEEGKQLEKEKSEVVVSKRRDLSSLIDSFIKAPLNSIKNRKRKITEEIDLK